MPACILQARDSFSNSSSKTKMSGVEKKRKGKTRKEKKWAKKNEKIRKLFRDLRDAETSTSNSIIVIPDDAPAPSNVTPRKKLSMHCSTPLAGNGCTMDNLEISSIVENTKNNNLTGNFGYEVQSLSNEIKQHKRNYQTVDLTGEVDVTCIDLNNVSDTQDCILVSDNTTMSGDSEVTVLRRPSNVSQDNTIKRVANGLNGMIANLGPSSQTKLLELITQNIFKGCTVPNSVKDNLIQDRTPCIGETPEEVYLKDMFNGQRPSNSSIGSNIYNPAQVTRKSGPRTIVIDGSNVAMEHGKGRIFSVMGLKICIDYFVNRGHEVRAFVPRFRCKFGKSTDPRLLDALERRGLVVYTPSREVQGRMISSYDDRYIVQYAAAVDGVIVSGDNFRDLLPENPRWRRTIERRVLPFTFVQDIIMFPRDPLGRNGPTLEHFLNHQDND